MAGGGQVLIGFLEYSHLLRPTLWVLFLLSVYRWGNKTQRRQTWLRVPMWD